MRGIDFVRATGVRVQAIAFLLGSGLVLAAACGDASPQSPAESPPASAAAPMPSPSVLHTPEPAGAPAPLPTAAPTPTATVLEGSSLAYATVDGRIQTARPDGSAATTISPDEGFFSWPMWSPDGRYVVFSGTSPGGNGPGPLALYLYDLKEERRRVLYFNDPGMGPILPTMAHYPLWSPDGQRAAGALAVHRECTLWRRSSSCTAELPPLRFLVGRLATNARPRRHRPCPGRRRRRNRGQGVGHKRN